MFWAVWFVPMALERQKPWWIVITVAAFIPIEVYLHRDLSTGWNTYLGDVSVIFVALFGGFIMHYFNQRERARKNQDENTD